VAPFSGRDSGGLNIDDLSSTPATGEYVRFHDFTLGEIDERSLDFTENEMTAGVFRRP